MRTGANNWNLTVRRNPDGVTILRAGTCDERAALPDSLDGLPVTALGDRALAPDARAVEGEAVRIVCGPSGDAAWDNRRLRELSLPAPLRRAGDYALLNCRALERLRLHDNGALWGSGALMNCRSLAAVELLQDRGDRGGMAYFAGELNGELEISVIRADRTVLRLLFPAYRELYEENSPAHHFDYGIEGAGYPYHHCFPGHRLDLIGYDLLWTKTRALEPETALRLAWNRLRYPEGLTTEAAARYTAYLRTHVRAAASGLAAAGDASGLRFLFRTVEPDRTALTAALAAARERRHPEAAAVLLEEQHRRFPVRDEDRFAL